MSAALTNGCCLGELKMRQSITAFLTEITKNTNELCDQVNIMPYAERDIAIFQAELSFYRMCDVPITEEIDIVDGDISPDKVNKNEEWQYINEEEGSSVLNYGVPYATFSMSCRGAAYVVDGYCSRDGACFRGTNGTPFQRVASGSLDYRRMSLDELAKKLS